MLEEVERRIRDRIEDLKDHIAGGRPQDYATYCQAVGQIIGYRQVLDDIKDIEEKYQNM